MPTHWIYRVLLNLDVSVFELGCASRVLTICVSRFGVPSFWCFIILAFSQLRFAFCIHVFVCVLYFVIQIRFLHISICLRVHQPLKILPNEFFPFLSYLLWYLDLPFGIVIWIFCLICNALDLYIGHCNAC